MADALTAVSLDKAVDAFFNCEPDALAGRFGLYQRLRQEAPVFRRTGKVLITRHDDVTAILLDTRFENGNVDAAGELRSGWRLADVDALSEPDAQLLLDFYRTRDTGWISSANGEKHERLWGLAHKAFTPRVLRGMQDRVQQIVDELLANAIADGRMEVVGNFAWHLPLIVVGEMLDIPAADRHKIRQWAIDIGTLSGGSAAKMTENVRAGHRSLFALRDHLLGVFADRRGKPTTDLMSALLNAETESGDRFTQDELIFMTAQMVFAGHETTANLIGTGLGGLLSDRSQWQALCEDPSLIPPSVEELLRFCSPAQAINRWVNEETEVRGVTIRPGDAVMLMLGAANRDPEHFEQPEKLDVKRRDFKHVAFGLGPHYCLGASLNRLETTTALSTLVSRFPDMRLTEELKWAPNWQFMGLSRLPVELGRDRG